MKYLGDADFVIDYFRDFPPVKRLMPTLLPDGLALSTINLIELYDGAFGSKNPGQATKDLQAFLKVVTILPISRTVVRRTAALRVALRAKKAPLQNRAYDLIIAATALVYDLTLVSSNTRDFQDIPGLRQLEPRTGNFITH